MARRALVPCLPSTREGLRMILCFLHLLVATRQLYAVSIASRYRRTVHRRCSRLKSHAPSCAAADRWIVTSLMLAYAMS